MNYQESITWLYGTQLFGIKLGLDQITRLLNELGIFDALDDTKIIHVAGTNGKGSVCAFSEQILRNGGLKTGLFTSPHLISFRERIQISGVWISETDVSEGLKLIKQKVDSWETHPTFFEICLVLAMRQFCHAGCDVIILETGMGGRLDATNALKADVSVITSISLDHQQWLGETIREIASEKAGIIKPETPVVVADLHPEARDVVGRRALMLGVPYIEAHPLPAEWELGLKGPHQRENAALAVEAACRVEGERLTQEGIRESLAQTIWPGRFEWMEENRIVLDGAHNPQAAAALREAWCESFPNKKAHLVFGAVASKDIDEVFEALLPILGEVTFVKVDSQRAMEIAEMEAAFAELETGLKAGHADCLSEALAVDSTSERITLVTGSLFLVGEARGILVGKDFEPSLQ
ncbi:MAG: folylpolyglutamate synthase/dihydrofolate synthase family protein [Verrucomicrobiota bacterium]